MRIKTIAVILITLLITVVLMQNNQPVKFTFLFADFYISKLVMMTAVSVFAFILGVLVGRPGKPKYIKGYDEPGENIQNKTNTLSDEDRDYIN